MQELGLFGLIVFIVLFICSIRATYKADKEEQEDDEWEARLR